MAYLFSNRLYEVLSARERAARGSGYLLTGLRLKEELQRHGEMDAGGKGR